MICVCVHRFVFNLCYHCRYYRSRHTSCWFKQRDRVRCCGSGWIELGWTSVAHDSVQAGGPLMAKLLQGGAQSGDAACPIWDGFYFLLLCSVVCNSSALLFISWSSSGVFKLLNLQILMFTQILLRYNFYKRWSFITNVPYNLWQNKHQRAARKASVCISCGAEPTQEKIQNHKYL